MKLNKLVIAVTLALLFSSCFAVLSPTSAHTPAWQIPTYAYVTVSPDPVGVGQTMFVLMWVDKVLPSAAVDNDIRFKDYKLTITRPDGTTEVKTWPIVHDTTSSQYTLFTPTQTGIYKFKFEFPAQTYTWSGVYQNDTYLASSAETTLTVQQQAVETPPTYPLPTTYWSRPIEGQNTAWASIASNYINPTTAEHVPLSNRFQPDGIAPNTAHVMWTRPIQDGGIVGGSNVGVSGAAYYTGLSYEYRFVAPIIMQGRIYFPLPLSNSAAGSLGNTVGGGYTCVDLQTGEQIWTQDYTAYPTFGQLLWYDSPNQHGVIPYLWAVSGTTWIAYEPSTGKWLFNITNVPAGTNVYGPDGEILRYVVGPNRQWLACWNNTASIQFAQSTSGAGIYYWRPVGKVINGSTSYSWNITIPQLPAGSTIAKAIINDLILGSTPTSPPGQRWGTTDTYTFWAISLKPETRGQLLWQKDYQAPPGNLTRLLYAVDAETRTFLMADKETRQWSAYSLDNGNLLWGPVGDARDLNYYGTVGMGSTGQAGFPAYGNLYSAGYGGELLCYNLETGNLVWKYNNTNSGVETPWGLYPLFIGAIADGKVYCYSSEHSPNEPLYKGSLVRCIDAYTGEELWTIPSWAGVGTFGSEGFPVADGYIAYLNHYDAQIYTIGKGPSSTTVTASPKVVTKGSGVLIEGTVTDICAGAKQLVESGKFNVVPAMSDADQGDWMAYLYMQKPMPTNATGVPVRLTAIDANGAATELGVITTDLSGSFSYLWNNMPAEGKYTIVAAFEGSNSYWPSTAQTALGVTPQAASSPSATQPAQTSTPTATTTPTQTASTSPTAAPQPTEGLPTETLLIIGAAVVVIAVVAAAAVLLKRRQ